MPCVQDYVMGALSRKTVLLVTHQVDFLPAFDSVLVGIPVKLCCFLCVFHLFINFGWGYFHHYGSDTLKITEISFSNFTKHFQLSAGSVVKNYRTK